MRKEGGKMQYNSLKEFLDSIKVISKNNAIYIWGISIYGNLLGILLNEKGISWNGYYDNFNSVEDNCLNSKPVFKSIDVELAKDAFYILSMRNYEAVKNQLLENKIEEEHIIFFRDAQILDCLEEVTTAGGVSVKKLKSFQNIHSGEKCFIIGNGPSLCIEDLDMIYKSGIKSFACNLIFKCYEDTLWRPDYYFFTDGVGIRKTFGDVEVLKYALQNCKYMFSRSSGYLSIYADSFKNLVLFRQVFSSSEEKFDFSIDCSDKVYIGYTVTYIMIQMAAYMGFKGIYLLGMDHDFSLDSDLTGTLVDKQEIDNHSNILGNYPIWGLPNTKKTTLAYISAKTHADMNGIKIYNATRGGKLEVFERVSFDEIFDIGRCKDEGSCINSNKIE